MSKIDILIVGPTGYTHVASSLARAALSLGLRTELIDSNLAYQGQSILRKFAWHICGRRPLRLAQFSRNVADFVADRKPDILLTVGQAPLDAQAVSAMRRKNVHCINWSTDDPWNPAHRSAWYLDCLRHYNDVFTPRLANIGDFQNLGCPRVKRLPFGYDPDLFSLPEAKEPANVACHDILFVGGADRDRVEFFDEFMQSGLSPTFAGGYWDRYPSCRAFSIGKIGCRELSMLTNSSSVNLCLVRRANRDGHVMRTFEIPAAGGFMIAEDTPEHRMIFGEEGECVLYFASPREAADKTRWALAHPAERAGMALAARRLVVEGAHTYSDRLRAMLGAARE